MSVYDIVMEQIIAKLEKGVIPWKQTWKSGQLPMNFISKKPYRGINVLLLSGHPYTSPYYMSFKQISEKGGKVKAGEQGHIVVFFKPVSANDDGVTDYLVMRYYLIWNLGQTTLDQGESLPAAEILSCNDLIAGMPGKPRIDHGLSNPCYIPLEDRILLPPVSEFDSPEEYHAALFHELVHSTGHEKRLARFRCEASAMFGSESYSEEELVAEIGASFLCGQSGILPVTLNNNAAYIRNWLDKLKGDKRIFIRAASHAQKAVDYISGKGLEPGLDVQSSVSEVDLIGQVA